MLLFVAVVAGKAAYRFGAPALLLFLGVGMLFGLDFITYRSLEVTQFVGMTALCIILFTGGMDTKFSQIRPVIGPGVVLATAGVIVTAFVLGGFVWLVAPAVGVELPFMTALLLAATRPRPIRRRCFRSCAARTRACGRICGPCWSWKAVPTTRWPTCLPYCSWERFHTPRAAWAGG